MWGIQRDSRSQRALNVLLSRCDFTLRTQEGDTKGLKLGVGDVMIRFMFLEGDSGCRKWLETGCPMRRKVQVSQARDDGGLDRAVAWSYLGGIFIRTG